MMAFYTFLSQHLERRCYFLRTFLFPIIFTFRVEFFPLGCVLSHCSLGGTAGRNRIMTAEKTGWSGFWKSYAWSLKRPLIHTKGKPGYQKKMQQQRIAKHIQWILHTTIYLFQPHFIAIGKQKKGHHYPTVGD